MTPDTARAILRKHGWTQKQVADGVDVSLRSMQRWLTANGPHVPGPLAAVLRIWDEHPITRPTGLGTDEDPT